MHSIAALATLLVMTLLLAPTVVVAAMLGIKEKPGGIYERCMRLWARSMSRAAGVRVVVHGEEHVRNGAIYIQNHVSWFDIFAVASVLPRYTFIAKSELRKIPLFGHGAEAAGIVFIDRDNRKSAFESYKVAAAEVQRGRNVVVCPEGTRGRDYHLRPFKKGPFVLAIAAGAPVVPVVVYGALEVMRKGSLRVRPNVVHIHFLEPVPTAGYTYEDRTALMRIVWQRMADAMRELYDLRTNEYPIAKEKERKEA
ncbi:MAG: 1-acyl-sn-glycerol-3-phosphate acyltransferase [Gemmatimonadota bacterium]|nr:1-acyl-sn-glycerol-3-phosphate acyltransferase [Gemmatimonadota bacterium]